MTAEAGRGYVPHIDGLRAIAVLAVIVFHLDPAWLPGGFTGVDVFFVISGFVVSASVHRLPPLSLGASMLRFYARRIRRIAPALVTCLLVTALASVLFIPESWLSEASDKTGLMAFFGLGNWVLAAVGNDYFAPKAEFNPYTHTWSLGVEEQFYLLFPLLFLAWARGARGRWLSLGLFALVSAASLLHAAVLGLRDVPPSWAFYATTTRLWQLGVGVLLFQLLHVRASLDPLTQRSLARGAWVFSLLAVLSLALLGWALWTARAGHSPWPDSLLPAFATAGLLWSLHHHPQAWIGRVLASAPLRRIGLLSYSLPLALAGVRADALDRGPGNTAADALGDVAGGAAVLVVVALGGTALPWPVGAARDVAALGGQWRRRARAGRCPADAAVLAGIAAVIQHRQPECSGLVCQQQERDR